jgi:hypothetical protein
MRWSGPVTKGALLTMEAIWTYALVAVLVAAITDGGKPSVLGVCAVVFLSFSISRVLQNSELELGPLRVWGTALSLLVFYAIVRIDFFEDWRLWDFGWANDVFYHAEESFEGKGTAVVGVPLLWLFWVRGVLRGQQTLDFENVLGSFGLGLLIIAVVQVVQGGLEDAPAALGKLAVPYVAIGLLAISLAHASKASGERSRPFASTWLVSAGASVIALGGVALLVALFDLGAATRTVNDVLSFVGGIADDAVYYALWPVLKLAELAFLAIRWVIDLIADPQPPDPRRAFEPELEEETQQRLRELPRWLDLSLRALAVAVVLAVIALLTAVLFRRFRKLAPPEAVRESVYSEGRFGADLGGLLGSLLGRFRSGRGRAPEVGGVRLLYREVLAAAAERGAPRPPPRTPLEFAPTLERTFGSAVTSRITDAYDDARYGRHDLDGEELGRLRREWERLRRGEQ